MIRTRDVSSEPYDGSRWSRSRHRRGNRCRANYRRLRTRGITIRSSVDLLIGTYCLRHNCRLLHQDRDFTAMERHLGLRRL